jgi:hypothetical protein
LDAISTQVPELEPPIGSSRVGEKLKLLVSPQSVRKGLAVYPAIGTRALKAGTFAALGELIAIEPIIKDSCDKPEVRKLIDI